MKTSTYRSYPFMPELCLLAGVLTLGPALTSEANEHFGQQLINLRLSLPAQYMLKAKMRRMQTRAGAVHIREENTADHHIVLQRVDSGQVVEEVFAPRLSGQDERRRPFLQTVRRGGGAAGADEVVETYYEIVLGHVARVKTKGKRLEVAHYGMLGEPYAAVSREVTDAGAERERVERALVELTASHRERDFLENISAKLRIDELAAIVRGETQQGLRLVYPINADLRRYRVVVDELASGLQVSYADERGSPLSESQVQLLDASGKPLLIDRIVTDIDHETFEIPLMQRLQETFPEDAFGVWKVALPRREKLSRALEGLSDLQHELLVEIIWRHAPEPARTARAWVEMLDEEGPTGGETVPQAIEALKSQSLVSEIAAAVGGDAQLLVPLDLALLLAERENAPD